MSQNMSDDELLNRLHTEAAQVPVPESLKPEEIKKKLEGEMEKTPNINGSRKKRFPAGRLVPLFAAAACLALAVGIYRLQPFGGGADSPAAGDTVETQSQNGEAEPAAGLGESESGLTASSYEEIYNVVHKVQQDRAEMVKQEKAESEVVFDGGFDYAEGENGAADGAMTEGGAIYDSGSSGTLMAEMASEEMANSGDNPADFSTTNLQVENIDEEDVVKTDGKYLYHLVDSEKGRNAISIVKAEGSQLEEVSRIDGLDDVGGFYLYGDMIVAVETIWIVPEQKEDGEAAAAGGKEAASAAVSGNTASAAGSEGTASAAGGENTESVAVTDGRETEDIFVDTASYVEERPAARIRFYDIADRGNPKLAGTLTTDGSYASSRISGDYFYLITQYYPSGEADLRDASTYVPSVGGGVIDCTSIVVPEGIRTDNYLVVASVSLDDITKFADSKAILSGGGRYYVSQDNIYVADTCYQDGETYSNATNIVRFRYKNGAISPEKSGSVKGEVLDDFAMDEYNGYFRVVTTVYDYDKEVVVDEITGETLGYHYGNETKTNSLYVLDGKLEVVGKLEGLAEEEQVYSARFIGNTGYFVTFKQIDPLFSVDLTDPSNPKILGELKISGFSEYLHFYDDGLLLGIGREVDPDTLSSKGLKLSMFDISDPSNVKEVNKLVLSDLDYSEALYQYKAVLIDTEKNLFGFPCEGTVDGRYASQYRTFSYDPDKGFVEGIRWQSEDDWSSLVRGSYIDRYFYVLRGDGGVTAYHLGNNQKIGELKN